MTTGNPDVDNRRQHFEDIFKQLQNAGELVQLWQCNDDRKGSDLGVEPTNCTVMDVYS